MFRHSQAVKTQDLDSCIAGSNPAAEATSCSTNNIEELLKLLTTFSFIGGLRPRFYFFYFIYLYHYNGNKYYSCHYYDGKEFNYECTYLFRSTDKRRSHER